MTTGRDTTLVLSGAAFCVLIILAVISGGSPPSDANHASRLLDEFAAERTRLLAESYLAALAMIPLLVFSCVLSLKLDGGGRQRRLALIAFGCAIAAIAAVLVASAFNAALAIQTEFGLSAAEASMVFRIGEVALAYTAIPLIPLLVAAALAGHRLGLMPRWLIVLSALVVVLQAVSTLGIVLDSALFSHSGPLGRAALGGLVVWIGAVSATVRDGRGEPSGHGGAVGAAMTGAHGT